MSKVFLDYDEQDDSYLIDSGEDLRGSQMNLTSLIVERTSEDLR